MFAIYLEIKMQVPKRRRFGAPGDYHAIEVPRPSRPLRYTPDPLLHDQLVSADNARMKYQVGKRLASGLMKATLGPTGLYSMYQGGKYIYDTASKYNPFTTISTGPSAYGQLGGSFYASPGKNDSRNIVYAHRDAQGNESDVVVGQAYKGWGDVLTISWSAKNDIKADLMSQGMSDSLASTIVAKIDSDIGKSKGMIWKHMQGLFGGKVERKARASSAKPYMSTAWLRALPQYQRMMIKRYFDRKGEGANFSLYLHTGVKSSHKVDKCLKEAIQLYRIR